MVLMHDGLILGLTPQDFIFKLVIFVVVFLVAFLVERFAIKLSKKALDSSKLPSASIFVNILRGVIWAFAILGIAACLWYSTNSVCNRLGSYLHCLVFWPAGHHF